MNKRESRLPICAIDEYISHLASVFRIAFAKITHWAMVIRPLWYSSVHFGPV